jgi:hypothetical protein
LSFASFCKLQQLAMVGSVVALSWKRREGMFACDGTRVSSSVVAS